MPSLKGKTVIVTGSSRGIGRAIALRCAKDGANVVIAAKTAEPHGKLAGTIFTVAEEVKAAGGNPLAFQIDVRQEEQIQALIEKTVETFGGIDILVNNAAAISLTPTEQTPAKRFDLMQQINVRGTFLCSQAALPYLKKAANPHILNLSPPLNLDPKWLGPHIAYTISKYGMTLCTLGMAAELKKDNISVTSLWPRLLIETAATVMLLGNEQMQHTRKVDIVSDAAYFILTSERLKYTGQVLLDEDVLKANGQSNFDHYATSPGAKIHPDLYV